MAEGVPTVAPAERPAPSLTVEQMEAALLLLLEGKWNGWAGLIARPEKITRARKRAQRALAAEQYRALEAPLNIAAERLRRGQ